MPIITAEIKYFLSGGASNAVPGSSLGGVKSSVEVDPATLWDTVSGDESAAGDVEYRCVYVANTNASLTLASAAAWLLANTANANTTIDIGVGTSAINGTEQTVGSETTAPTGITFLAAATKGAGAALGSLPATQHRAVWLRRTVTAGAAASADAPTLKAEGETAA